MKRSFLSALVVLLVVCGAVFAWVCPRCKQNNPDDANFCGKCGAKVFWKCPQCGTDNPAGNQFCSKCGLERGKKPKGDAKPEKPAAPDGKTPSEEPPPATSEKPDKKSLDERVEEAIAKGIEFLWNRRKTDGSWEGYDQDVMVNGQVVRGYFKYPSGPTAIAAYALLESGVSPQDERMAKVLDWLARQSITKTYSLALRANVWQAANRTTNGKYRDLLAKDAKQLWDSTVEGAYGYDSTGTPDKAAPLDHSNSQYGVLGVWAAARDDLEVPVKYWEVILNYWRKVQKADGGWGYGRGSPGHPDDPRASMTAAGIATLFVCKDNLSGSKYIACRGEGEEDLKPIQAGLDWFEKHFEASLKQFNTWWFYYVYCMERVGLASGYKYFGASNWYTEGARRLLAIQEPDGRWGDGVPDTSFALLFLIRGRHPVLFNKLQYEGDWNNRPRDLAALTQWISKTFENTVNWQIIHLKTDVREWHDAPILYIAGSKEPKFADADIDKLRQFVWQGGTIFSVTECSGSKFRAGMLAAYRKMFPKYEMTFLPPDHDIYNAHFKLKGNPRLGVVGNGIRPLAIHTDVDLPKSWQLRNWTTQRWAFEAAANLYMYLTDRGQLRHRGTSPWPDPPASPHGNKVRLARLNHSGDPDPEPLAYERLRLLLASRADTDLEVVGPIEIAQLAESGARVAAMTGTGEFTLSAADRQALKAFVEGGGTLVIDAAGGARTVLDPSTKVNKTAGFAASAERELEALFGRDPLRRLATTADVLNLPGLEIKDVQYRRLTRTRLAGLKTPNLLVVTVGNRPAVFYSREDLTAALVGYPASSVDGYEPDSAFALMRNILLSAGKK